MSGDIERVEQKIDMFMDSQQGFNKTVTEALSQISTAITKSETLQVELNSTDARLADAISSFNEHKNDIKSYNDAIREEVKDLQIEGALAKEVVSEHKKIRWLVIALFVGAGITTTISSSNGSTESKKMLGLMEKQALAMEHIADKLTKAK